MSETKRNNSLARPEQADTTCPRLSFVVPVNREDVLADNILRSRVYREGRHEFLFQRGYANVSKAYNDARERAAGDLLIFCHQDVFFPDDWERNFLRSLRQMETLDPRWGVLGAAGVRLTNRWGKTGVVFIGDLRFTVFGGKLRLDFQYPRRFPQEAHTLDELLLVVRKADAFFDETLPHHHLYGADLCLRLAAQSRKAYAISAYLHHNMTSGWQGPDFRETALCLYRKHKARLPVASPCVIIEEHRGQPRLRSDAMGLIALSLRSFFHKRRWSRTGLPRRARMAESL